MMNNPDHWGWRTLRCIEDGFVLGWLNREVGEESHLWCKAASSSSEIMTGPLCSDACWRSCDLVNPTASKGKRQNTTCWPLCLQRSWLALRSGILIPVLMTEQQLTDVQFPRKEILIWWNRRDDVNVTEQLHSHLDIDHQVTFQQMFNKQRVASTQTAGWERAWRRRASAPLLTKQLSARRNSHLLLSLFRTITN